MQGSHQFHFKIPQFKDMTFIIKIIYINMDDI